MNRNKIYKEQDVLENLLEDKVVGIIGYGNQGRAQALNLKDSGVKTIIGLRKTSKSKFPDEYVATYSKNLSEPERQLYFKHLVDKGWESVYSPTAGSFWRRKQI